MIKVHSHIAGSYCTIQLLPNWELYIEARKDIRLPSFNFIEVVCAGQVVHRENLPDEYAPAKLIELIRRYSPIFYRSAKLN
jgi:hypothetical protein